MTRDSGPKSESNGTGLVSNKLLNEHPGLSLQSYCDDPDLVLDLKNLIVLFADTLQVCVWMSD